jgi:hypothetical protein
MGQTIKLKRSATPSAVPTIEQLDLGEVAINTYDGKVFIKRNNGTETVVPVGLPSGGGQYSLLEKINSSDYAAQWTNTPTVNAINFNTSAGLTPEQGQVTWDSEEGTALVGLVGGDLYLKVGQELQYRVINNTGIVIPKGALVRAAGTLGASGKILVAPWDGTVPSKYIIGVTSENMPFTEMGIEGAGYVTAFGKLRGLQTNGGNYSETWVDGDILYAGANGGLTKIMPTAPAVKTTVAIVINAHASNGELFIRPTYGSNLAEDELVQLSSLQNGNTLAWNATNGRFENTSTLSSVLLADGYTEEIFAITDGGTVNLDPNNGSIQTWTLGAGRTPGQANWAAGQSILLMVTASTNTITWSTLSVVWKTDTGAAPVLNSSGVTAIVLWKVGTTIFGARVGDA